MPSEPRHAPFRMPERLFAELAAGGGSAEAVAFLERAERARRLLLLRTLLEGLGTLRTPLSPAAEAWDVLREAAAAAPGPVDRLLLAPATGGWLAHVLRRLHGTASGPPLWAEAGHLCALAVAAALRAGTRSDLRVPLTDGGLSLPGLGLARLTGAEGGLTVARARTSGGELTLSGPGRDGGSVAVTLSPATQPLPRPTAKVLATDTTPAWSPLRTLTHATPAGTVAIPLEDLDPYRDLDDPLPPARLDADEAEAWQRLFEEAVALLAAPGGEGPGRFDPGAIRAVVPWGRTGTLPPAPPTVLVSASSGDSFGAMVIARPSSTVALAETLVHEFQHSKLAALLHLFPLLDDDREERYYAPWRPDPRHLTGLLHGAYAFTGVAGFWRDRMAVARDDGAADIAGYHFALRRLQSRLVVRTLLVEGRLTPQGRALVSGLARTLDGWLREPVPYAALTRARTAAALHRTEWRLRNVAPPSSGSGGPRFRPDRTSWPDVRTHAFAARPVAPHTADEQLAAGDAAAALARYADRLATDPAEPHALAGWIVARAVLEPGRTTRRMLARPELLQPLPSG
ncbi:aKG-HExxH-type peptide beta-hydroxylase [Streptomyces purpurascens]|uniref:aKG-HExxH-type peptide beta-hydroxylase n=1 Tax=Streptomyces purpurascens TaxID=1924 RepID=UPI0016736673|nr:HEXXH motif-containing putative peptide modification protein [Streptomyces purpurascens]MCE7046146.1 HEXXH motif-containing putative peptide modification protein [Streptomyces purpurascens]GGZ99018.1 HEXXH motif domain-containing protein [Streptomyces purpurascens]